MPRPTKLPADRRTEQVKIRLTLGEAEHLRDSANAASLSLAEYVRRRALSLPVVPAASRADAQLLSELNRIGVNVNQIARAANSGREFKGNWLAIEEEIARLLEEVSTAYAS